MSDNKSNSNSVPRLQDMYNQFAKALQSELSISNVMQVPKLEKIVLNIGQSMAVSNVKILEGAQKDLSAISGQKPIITKARKSIAGFKLRQGQPIGVSVTLRGSRMYEFFDRMLNIAIPRIRDFRGFSVKSFDGNGNYSLGFKEIIVFPEIDFDNVDMVRGLGVSIITSTSNDKYALALLNKFAFPFKIKG